MNVIEMRACVRCGVAFRPLDIDQMCCSDECSAIAQNRFGLSGPTALVRIPQPLPPVPERTVIPRGVPRRGPVFVGSRFVVFEWQIEQLARMLGPLIDDFDLHEWFFTLDSRMMNSAEIIPQRDGGQWLQNKTLEEAQRRGLMTSQAPQMGKQTSRLAQALANIKKGFRS